MLPSTRKGKGATVVPIDLPHDGPLYFLISQNEAMAYSNISDDDVSAKIVDPDEASLDGCIIFLSHASYALKESPDGGLFSDKINLLYLLTHASHIHEQLRALQKFRNKTIQKQSCIREEVQTDSSAVAKERIADRILYRILLEWMISVLTPVPLRRAVASCLSVLLPSVPTEIENHGLLTRKNVLFGVLESIVQPSYHDSDVVKYWRNPLHSLYELLTWGSAEEFFSTEACIAKVFKFLQLIAVCNTENQDCDIDNQITLMANSVNKIFILAVGKDHLLTESLCDESHREIVADLQLYLWNTILRHDIPIDRLSSIGIAYGRTVQRQLLLDHSASMTLTLSALLETVSKMASVVQRATVLQGLAVIVPMHSSSVVELMVACRRIFTEAADPDVRGLALKGVRTLISRIHTWYSNASAIDTPFTHVQEETWLDVEEIRQLVDNTLDVVLQAWENPPTRNLANAISALFEDLIQLLLLVSVENFLDKLTERLLAQAPNMKCRYLALEVLMPITGASKLVESNAYLLHDLLVGIGDKGHNTCVIADLWAKLLKHLLMEFHRDKQIHPPPNKCDEHLILSDWMELWSPSLVFALSSKDFTRRKQVAAFCLPRVFAMEFNNPSRYVQLALILKSLFASVDRVLSDKRLLHHRHSIHGETIADRMFWVELEIIRYASAEGLLKVSSEGTKCIRDVVAERLPKRCLKSGLVHDVPSIRIATLQVFGSVVGTYDNPSMSSLDIVRSEVELWMFALPSSIKTDGSENILSIHQSLLLFLDRLLLAEASSLDETKVNCADCEVRALPLFHSFVVGFLINDVLLKKTGYPGTVVLKESFLLSLMECLIVFSARDHPLARVSKLLPKNLPVFKRRRLIVEEIAINDVKKSLSSFDVFSCLKTLLQSTWDSSRNGAYRILVGLLSFKNGSIIAPLEICNDATFRTDLLSKGILLASSPRQREADTGAKLISFAHLSFSSVDEKLDLIASLVDLLDRRLTLMKQQLSLLLRSTENHCEAHGLPLAYGFVHALRLIAERSDLAFYLEHAEYKDSTVRIFDKMISLFFSALRVSLAVVADVNNGEFVDGMDEEILAEFEGGRSTIMVNPSAIGANGIFSSVKRFSSAETSIRLASQRIVIGSWLLTKETCAAIASVLSLSAYKHSTAVYDEAGILLISTLTALKHTGAAFAAHRALQIVAENCFFNKSNAIAFHLPEKWGLRMIAEISDSEKIRDSILRRSTGYSLGFLSLMRAEVTTQKLHPCCISLLIDIARLCLPSISQWNEFTTKMKVSDTLKCSFFPFSIHDQCISLVGDCHFSFQARVHALNVLRSCLLDSPIANDVFPFVGIAFIAAMIGYTDSEWSVRNSSTMVFSAAMLRAIDPDKNSLRVDATGRNAITADELFRSFPALAPFLLAVLNGGLHDTFAVQKATSLHPALPILLLLSRIQPISQSGDKSMLHVELFVPVILKYLYHQHINIRKGAARAIRNMISEQIDSPTSFYNIMPFLQQELSVFSVFGSPNKDCQWNYLHGLLLTINELAMFSPDAKNSFCGSNLLEDMFALTTVYEGSLRVPHLCVMVAIEIIWHLVQNHDCDSLLLKCRAIISYLEKVHKVHLFDIGSAELAAKVSSILTAVQSPTIIYGTTSSDKLSDAIDDLSSLLCADCLDLRCTAVKTFKKILCNFIDHLPDAQEPSDQFDDVAELLYSAIIHELERDSCYGPHPPTLRRLSRCLIDWVDANVKKAFTNSQMNSRFKFADLAISLLHSRSCHAFIEADPISMSQLNGNALEILNLKDDPLNAKELKLLVQLVRQLSNSSCYWRVRLSAAQTLGRLADVVTEETSMFSTHENSLLLGAWLALLQDEDFYVRQAAFNATMRHCHFQHDALITGSPCVQKATHFSVNGFCPNLVDSMFSFLYLISDDIGRKMNILVDNLTQTNVLERFPLLVNDTDTTAIFESENPNSYVELCVECQLVVGAIINITESTPFWMNDDFVALTNSFLKSVHAALDLLQNFSHDKACLASVTHSYIVFPCLHSILLSTSTLIYTNGESFKDQIDDIKLVATRIISLNTVVSGFDPLHPLIVQAMQCLLHANQSNLQTRKMLSLCCFLASEQI